MAKTTFSDDACMQASERYADHNFKDLFGFQLRLAFPTAVTATAATSEVGE